jgi:hypothetical protein
MIWQVKWSGKENHSVDFDDREKAQAFYEEVSAYPGTNKASLVTRRKTSKDYILEASKRNESALRRLADK